MILQVLSIALAENTNKSLFESFSTKICDFDQIGAYKISKVDQESYPSIILLKKKADRRSLEKVLKYGPSGTANISAYCNVEVAEGFKSWWKSVENWKEFYE